MDDFIDDGEGEEGRARRRRRAAAGAAGYASQAMAEAARIFGDATVRYLSDFLVQIVHSCRVCCGFC
jgi:hypothetical protein